MQKEDKKADCESEQMSNPPKPAPDLKVGSKEESKSLPPPPLSEKPKDAAKGPGPDESKGPAKTVLRTPSKELAKEGDMGPRKVVAAQGDTWDEYETIVVGMTDSIIGIALQRKMRHAPRLIAR